MAAIVAACVLCGIAYLHYVSPLYTVQMSVVAAPDQVESTQVSVGGAGAALLSQLSGATGGQQSNLELYLAGLHSIETARALAQQPAIMHRMFNTEWSASDQSWHEVISIKSILSRFIKSLLGIHVLEWRQPDAARVLEFLQSNVSVSRSATSPVVVIGIQTGDTQFGLDLLRSLHDTVDGLLRRRMLDRTTSYIAYLNSRIPQATIVEYRQALAETIVQQERVRMVAASGSPYAADMFGRPTASRKPTSPAAPAILAVSLLTGIFLAFLEAVSRDRLRLYKRVLENPSSSKGLL